MIYIQKYTEKRQLKKYLLCLLKNKKKINKMTRNLSQ